MASAQASYDVGSTIEPTVIPRYLQNISTYLFCIAERKLRTIIMQNADPRMFSNPKQQKVILHHVKLTNPLSYILDFI